MRYIVQEQITSMNVTEYDTEIKQWRVTLDLTLRRENSWLSLAGLYWLREGENTFGSASDNTLVLEVPDAPAYFGTILLEEGRVRLQVPDSLPATVDGQKISNTDLLTDINGTPSVIEYGSLRWIIIERGERFAIRLWDNNSTVRQTFTGRKWYPVDPALRVPAIYSAHEPALYLELPSVDGDQQEISANGYVTFLIGGRECRLEALDGPGGGLFLIFKDLTNGDSSYGAGRYLTTLAPEKGVVILDFNRAYNPPCAFTPYATCALPPVQNALGVRIEAGELFGGPYLARDTDGP
jgi:uncharacterized protein (DUF1684 family)